MKNHLFTILVLLLVIVAVPVSADLASLERTQGLYDDLEMRYNALRVELESTCDATSFALLQEQAINAVSEARTLYDSARQKAELDLDLATKWTNLANRFLVLSLNFKSLNDLEISCTEEPGEEEEEPETPADTDGDGIADRKDNCPLVANADQTDSDSDGKGDACEEVPEEPETPETPEDTDGDGIPNGADNCPEVANPLQEDADNNKVGDACEEVPEDPETPETPEDTDGDGIADGKDNCPLVANADQTDSDSDGKGDICEVVTVEDFENFLANATGAYGDFETIVNEAQTTLQTTCDVEEIGINKFGLAGTLIFTSLFQTALEESSLQLIEMGETELAAEFTLQADQYGLLILRIVGLIDYENPACEGTPEDPVDTDSDGIVDTEDNCINDANADQLDTDSDGVGDVCEETPLTLQEQFNAIENQYDDYKEDFDDDLEDDYKNAVRRNDEDDIEDAEDELKDLRNDLRDLRTQLNTLEDEVKLSEPDNTSLLNDIDDLIDDINDLRKDIKDVLNGEDNSSSNSGGFDYTTNYNIPSTSAPSVGTGTVVLEPLILPEGFNSVQDTTSNKWGSVRTIAWIAGGMIILLAIILFLLAMLLK